MLLRSIIFILSLYVIKIQGTCSICPVPSCNNLNYSMPTALFKNGQCDQLNLFSAVQDSCGTFVIPHFCAYFDAASTMNSAVNCVINGSNSLITPWCYDYCLTTYSCIPLEFQQAFLPNCSVQSNNNDPTCAKVNQTLLDKYSTTTPVAIAPRPCPVYNLNQTLPKGYTFNSIAMGNLWDYLECQNCSKDQWYLRALNSTSQPVHVPYVLLWDASFETLFPSHCANWLGIIQVPGYGVFFILWWVYSFFWLCLFRKRDNRPPISARNLVLVYFQFVTQQIWFPLFMEPSIFKTNASCAGSSIFGAGFGVPVLVVPLILRALRLYYLYRWNQSKVDPDKSDWYFQHKYLLKTRASVVALILLLGGSFFLSMMCYIGTPEGTRKGTVLASGRCYWWEFNDDVQAYAKAAGVSLSPNAFNPTGYIPYSADIQSCFFCYVPLGLKLVYTFEAQVFLYLGMYCLWLLRNLNDQYALWNELVQAICVMMLGFPTAIPELFDQYRLALQFTPEVNFIDIVVCLIFVWSFHASCVYPTLLTYLPENKSKFENRLRDSSTTGGSSNSVGSGHKSTVRKKEFVIEWNKMKGDLNVNVHTILLDPLGVEAFRMYCVEAFVVENVQYLIAIRDYEDMDHGVEKAREAVRIFKEFVKTGCRLEVNISFTMRSAYEKIFEEPPAIAPLPNLGAVVPRGQRTTWRASFISLGKKLLGAPEDVPSVTSDSRELDGSSSRFGSARSNNALAVPRASAMPRDPSKPRSSNMLSVPRPSQVPVSSSASTSTTGPQPSISSSSSQHRSAFVTPSLLSPTPEQQPKDVASPTSTDAPPPLEQSLEEHKSNLTLSEPFGDDTTTDGQGGTIVMAVITPRGSMIARQKKALETALSPASESESSPPPSSPLQSLEEKEEPDEAHTKIPLDRVSSDPVSMSQPNSSRPNSQPNSPSLGSRRSDRLESDDAAFLLPIHGSSSVHTQTNDRHSSRAVSFLHSSDPEPVHEEKGEEKDKEKDEEKDEKEEKDDHEGKEDSHDVPLKYADVTFEDITLEVKQLVANDWVRFKKSKHWSKLVQEVASRKKLGKVFGGGTSVADSELARTGSTADVELASPYGTATDKLRAPSQWETPARTSRGSMPDTPEDD